MIPPFTYETLEDDLVKLLKPLADEGIEVAPLADTDSEHTTPFETSRISVFYASSEYSPNVVRGTPETLNTSHGVQDEFATVEIAFYCRTRRGVNGIFDLKLKAQKLLFGSKPTHFGRMLLKEFNFASHKDNIWVYIMTMTCKGMVVQCDDESPDDAPLLQTVDFNFALPPQLIVTENGLGLITENGLGIQSE